MPPRAQRAMSSYAIARRRADLFILYAAPGYRPVIPGTDDSRPDCILRRPLKFTGISTDIYESFDFRFAEWLAAHGADDEPRNLSSNNIESDWSLLMPRLDGP